MVQELAADLVNTHIELPDNIRGHLLDICKEKCFLLPKDNTRISYTKNWYSPYWFDFSEVKSLKEFYLDTIAEEIKAISCIKIGPKGGVLPHYDTDFACRYGEINIYTCLNMDIPYYINSNYYIVKKGFIYLFNSKKHKHATRNPKDYPRYSILSYGILKKGFIS